MKFLGMRLRTRRSDAYGVSVKCRVQLVYWSFIVYAIDIMIRYEPAASAWLVCVSSPVLPPPTAHNVPFRLCSSISAPPWPANLRRIFGAPLVSFDEKTIGPRLLFFGPIVWLVGVSPFVPRLGFHRPWSQLGFSAQGLEGWRGWRAAGYEVGWGGPRCGMFSQDERGRVRDAVPETWCSVLVHAGRPAAAAWPSAMLVRQRDSGQSPALQPTSESTRRVRAVVILAGSVKGKKALPYQKPPHCHHPPCFPGPLQLAPRRISDWPGGRQVEGV